MVDGVVGETGSGAMAGCPTGPSSGKRRRTTLSATLQLEKNHQASISKAIKLAAMNFLSGKFLTHLTALRAHNLDKDVRQRFEYQLKAITRNAPPGSSMDEPVIETQPIQSTSSTNMAVPVSPLSKARRKSQAFKWVTHESKINQRKPLRQLAAEAEKKFGTPFGRHLAQNAKLSPLDSYFIFKKDIYIYIYIFTGVV